MTLTVILNDTENTTWMLLQLSDNITAFLLFSNDKNVKIITFYWMKVKITLIMHIHVTIIP